MIKINHAAAHNLIGSIARTAPKRLHQFECTAECISSSNKRNPHNKINNFCEKYVRFPPPVIAIHRGRRSMCGPTSHGKRKVSGCFSAVVRRFPNVFKCNMLYVVSCMQMISCAEIQELVDILNIKIFSLKRASW